MFPDTQRMLVLQMDAIGKLLKSGDGLAPGRFNVHISHSTKAISTKPRILINKEVIDLGQGGGPR